MKIEKVSYQKAYVIGPYLQEKVGFEASIDGDSPEEVLSKLRKMADEWHRANNPLLQPGAEVGPSIQEIQEQKPRNTVSFLVEDIKSCTELKVLESYRILAKTKPELQAAYDEMLEKLTPRQ
jgi:hypothetical protein